MTEAAQKDLIVFDIPEGYGRFCRDGRFIEELGYYDPMTEPATVKVDGDKVKEWMANGAQPTDTVKSLLKKNGVID